MNPDCITVNELSLLEADELLVEVRLESTARNQPKLYDFAGLLRNLIALHQGQSAIKAERNLTDLTALIAKGLDEVRVVMDAFQPCFQQIDLLSEQAISQWGDLLVTLSIDGDQAPGVAWDTTSYCESENATDDEESIEVPSADAIRAMLGQISAANPSTTPVIPVEETIEEAVAETAVETAEEMAVETTLSRARTQQLMNTQPTASAVDALDPELREAFMDDATACLGSIENSLLRLESNRHDSDSLAQILRELHTLKGASGSVGLMALADQIHSIEDGLRDDQAAGREPSVDQLLTHVDQIRAQIGGSNNLPQLHTEATFPASSHNSSNTDSSGPLTAHAPVFSDEDGDNESVRVKSSQLNRLMDMLVELVMLRNQRETELAALQEVYHELISSGSKMRLLSNDRSLCSDSGTSLQLAEVASDVLETAQQVRECTRPFASGNAAVSRFIRQFRQELVELRRTPISGLFQRLQLVAREAARAESKQVRLILTGEDAGMERGLQQRLYEPLLHIVRNAICHGIESPEERIARGKAPEGTVTLEVTSGPNLFAIEIRDDGSGLDYEAIRRRGLERKLISADQVVGRDELSQLIFHPGFSTRESANQVGGRGVGMDVVAATMQRMRGWFEITSEPGQGTRIRLSIPLPSVIHHAMVFRCADQLFALPMESVQSAGDVASDVPRTSFARLLGLGASHSCEASQTIVVADDRLGSMQGKPSPLALFVDEIVGPEELVVRPLPSLLKRHPFCVGATLSGMGHTILLLDARRLLRSPTTSLQKTQPAPSATVVSQPQAQTQRLRVLVVDDSLSARKRAVRSLSRYPIDIVEACDGKDALEHLKKQTFAAVFSDMEMPNVDGMELLASVNASGRSDLPPIVIVSSRSEKEFTERARQLGAANYLIKPLVDEELDAALLQLAPLSHLVCDVTLFESEKLS